MNAMRDYYQVLQVPVDAGHKAIDAAYWRLAHEARAIAETAPEALAELNEAYEILRTPLLRHQHDASREEAAQSEAARPAEPNTPVPHSAQAGPPRSSVVGMPKFVDLLQLQVRQVRDRIRTHAESLEAPGDPLATSSMRRAFGHLRQL